MFFLYVNAGFNNLSFKLHYSSALSYSSHSTNTLVDVLQSPSSNTSSNKNIFFEFEDEFEENEEISKRNSLPVLTLTNLFRTFYLREVRTPFIIFHTSNYSESSIPLHLRNCILII